MSDLASQKRLGVSIVIPNYNYEHYVGEAIDSALAQTHAPVEVIVVDDGSTDDSRAVIESYGDRITAIFQANAGQTRACEVGLARATQPIVIFLDSDDRLVPEAAAMAAADWPAGCSKKQFRLQTLTGDGALLDHHWPKYPAELPPELVRNELLRTGYYQCPPTTANAFARKFLEQIMPFDEHPHVDAVMHTLAPLYGDVLTFRAVLGHYRQHCSNNYAIDRVEAARFRHYLAADRRRLAILATHCERLGVPFAGEQTLRNLLPYRELELVIAKLEGSGLRAHLDVLQHLLPILKLGINYPQGHWHRLIRWLWISMVAITPRRLAVPLIGVRYVPTARPPILERITGMFGRAATAS